MPTILALGTAVPSYAFSQNDFVSFCSRIAGLDEKQSAFMQAVSARSAIETRHVVIPDITLEPGNCVLIDPLNPARSPDTQQRNEIYKLQAPLLAAHAARNALLEWGGDAKDITHIIAISCTGMMAPGLEFLLIDSLGLSRDVHRFGLNFMGCFGAFRGLELAAAFSRESKEHRVLVVSVELCSLHFQYSSDPGTMIGNILFADGAAAAVIGVAPRPFEKPLWSIVKNAMHAFEGTTADMSWEISNHGFLMKLLPSVPRHVRAGAPDLVQRLLGDIKVNDCEWPVHPGGKAIIEGLEEALGLSREQTQCSWDILREYGNMSSATMLFVLDRLRRSKHEKQYAVSLGFGPGLSFEGILLKKEY
jgi:predicted naringenin-chalcone synthase